MIAYLFRGHPVHKLIAWGIVLLLVQLLVFTGLTFATISLRDAAAAPGAAASVLAEWQQMEREFGILSGDHLSQILATARGSYGEVFNARLVDNGTDPLVGLVMFGWETLAYMLFGMAALRSGFFTGEWSNARYRKAALIGFGIGIPAYALLAWAYARTGFTVVGTLGIVMAATVPFRPLMVVATGALIIIVTRQGGALVERIAAAGRAAFTNYLGTSIVMTTLFHGYGFGLFGELTRAQLWIVVFAMWALMLLWSKPWLERYRYGPFEWLWRTLARGGLQPMRKPLAPPDQRRPNS
jgi:uncharacterized protein